jgi:signal transduction histidine kinase/ActR/RegA family two-component response regulator
MFNRATSPSFRNAWIRRGAGLLAAALWMFLAALGSISFAHGMHVTPVWMANAVALSFVLRAQPGRRAEVLLACLAGNWAADVLTRDPLPLGLALSSCNAVEVALCASLMLRLGGPQPDLTRRRDLLVFIASAAVSALVSAVPAALALGLFRDQNVGRDLMVWAMGDAAGLVMVTPVLLMWPDVRAQLLARPLTWRQLIPLLLLAAATTLIFGQNTYPLAFIILPIWAAAAAELEFLGLTAGALIVGGVSIWLTSVGRGPIMMVGGGPVRQIMVLQLFIAFTNLTLLEFTAWVIQRRRLTQSLEVMTRQAEQRRAGAVEDHRRAQMAEAVAGLGYWRVDLKTGAMDWSPQIYKLFGLPRSLSPQGARLSERVHPDDLADARAGYDRVIATGEPQHQEVRIITFEGQVRIIRCWSTAERDETGAVCAVLNAVMDVTDQRQVESELRQARDAAEQAAVVKGEFLANMSHELRTPLTSILGFTSLAAAEAEMPETVRRYIDRVNIASKALLTLVNDVLDFSKLEAGEIRLEPRPTDMAALGGEVLALFSEQASVKGIDLALDLSPSLPAAILVDSDRLRQVLLNLVGNAIKFTDRGHVTLGLDFDEDEERLKASVLDTGPGIGPERRPHLFQRFSQVDGSSTRTFGGTGLGLAICKGLIEAMHGAIGVDTDEGRGACFWFEVPTTAVDPVEVARVSASVSALSLGNRFLVVDDNRANRDLVRAILATLGADIVEASNGLDGVREAMELPFDVILMDMRMPGLSGEEAVAEIRSCGPNVATPIIAFSASADAGQMDHLRRLGFDGCLPKPFTLTDVIGAVRAALASVENELELQHDG